MSSSTQTICGHCLAEPPAFDASRVPFLYRPPIDHFIKQLKFHRQLAFGPLLAALMAESLANEPLPELLLPVPLHRDRLRQRGFNQSQEIARLLAKALRMPMRFDLVERHKETEAQMNLHAEQRRKNVRGAFRVVKPLPVKNIAILDDVMTTGATANELALCLKAAGAEMVTVWAVARA